MPVSRTSVDSAAGKIADKRNDALNERAAELYITIIELFNVAPNGAVVKAMEILAGTSDKPLSDSEKAIVTAMLGLTPATTDDDSPRGIASTSTPTTSRMDEWAKVYESDGTTINTDIEKVRWDDTKAQANYGLVPFDGPEGKQALKKRPAPATTTGTPTGPTGGDRMVNVVNRKGHTVRQIKVKEGNADPSLEAILDGDGTTVDHFKEKSVLARRG
jgi:hypothetical protein